MVEVRMVINCLRRINPRIEVLVVITNIEGVNSCVIYLMIGSVFVVLDRRVDRPLGGGRMGLS